MDVKTGLLHASVYLGAAVIAVPLAKRLGLGSVLGYLIAGVVIGPYCLGLVGSETHDVLHVAELGVVMMLFLIGLELQPRLLWNLRTSIVGLGGGQVLGTGLLGMGVGVALGIPLLSSLAIGLILAMSSTAIVLQTLKDRGLEHSVGGRSIFSVLLFQDIAAIPLLALLPLMGAASSAGGDGSSGSMLIALGVVGLIIVSGRFLVRPLFRFIAGSGVREAFTATALLLVVGSAFSMMAVGLSAALGTFLAGVVLADSEYRHEMEADIEPFKGLLLGLFFISVGAAIDFGLVKAYPFVIAGIVAAIIAAKALVLFLVATSARMHRSERMLFTLGLAQGGEFAFVLFSFAAQHHVVPLAHSQILVASVALSMAIAPLLFILYQRYSERCVPVADNVAPPHDDPSGHERPVIIAGFGGFGQAVGRLLKANGVACTVFDLNPERVEILRRLGLKVFYGDAARDDLLSAAGAAQARLFVLAVGDEASSAAILETVQRSFPGIPILARANSRPHAYELIRRGVPYVYRDTLGSALDAGVEALRRLGFRAYQARRAAQTFKAHDDAYLNELAHLDYHGDEYLSTARTRIRDLERILEADRTHLLANADEGWDSPATKRQG